MDSIQLHGLSQLTTAKTAMRKGLWLGVLVGMFIGFLYNGYVSLSNYMSNPVVTSISVHTYGTLPYPTLLICPFDFIEDRSRGDYRALHLLSSEYMLREGLQRSGPLTVANGSTESVGRIPMTRAEFEKNLFQMAYSPHDTFLKCQINLQDIDCDDHVQQMIPSVQSGVCYAFDARRKQTHPGRGIRLYLHLVTKDNFTMFPFDGLSLHVGMDPAMAAAASPLLVDVGSYVKVDLALKQTIIVQTSKSSCEPGEPPSNSPDTTTTPPMLPTPADAEQPKYSQDSCQERRRQSFYHNYCGCLSWRHWLPEEPHKGHLPICTFDEMQACRKANKTAYKSIKYGSECPVPCDWWSVFTQENAIQLKGEGNLLARHFNLSAGRLVILDISYKDLKVETIQQKNAITFNTLMSNVGGLLGLWLGASAFTVIQIVLYVGRISTEAMLKSGSVEEHHNTNATVAERGKNESE